MALNGKFSSWKNTNSGVPQGSVLGPLLFLIFINDLSSKLEYCDINLFADDTVLLYGYGNKIDDGSIKVNMDLNNIFDWSQDWLVNFSAPKTKCMVLNDQG